MGMGRLLDLLFKIKLDEPEVVAKLIAETESGIYKSKDEDGCKVLVFMQQGYGMDVHTHQENGWIRVDTFGADGYKTEEMYHGRWR